MSVIWKYDLGLVSPRCAVDMPIGARVLHAHEQHGAPCIWAEVDQTLRTETRVFALIGTGHAFVPDNLHYIGTAHMMSGSLVLHVYEVLPPPEARS